MKQRAHLVVEGLVQGVCFRYFCQREALRRDVTGWVRNQRDGSVEIIAEGESDKLKQFVEWCRCGPPHARVTALRVVEEQASGEFDSFEVIG